MSNETDPMTNPEGVKPVQVEQADRIAANKSYGKICRGDEEGDGYYHLCQTLARHRLAHQPDTAAQPVGDAKSKYWVMTSDGPLVFVHDPSEPSGWKLEDCPPDPQPQGDVVHPTEAMIHEGVRHAVNAMRAGDVDWQEFVRSLYLAMAGAR